MKIQLLIATIDNDYAEHLSKVLSEKHNDSFDIAVCLSSERLCNMPSTRMFDVALIDSSLLSVWDMSKAKLSLLLWSDSANGSENIPNIGRIKKYQRISRISSDVMEQFAKSAGHLAGFSENKAHVTAVWSPAGGVGKTSVALAYAAQKAMDGNHVTYFDLEYFSSVPTYFNETGKSISSVFEQLDGNIELLIKAIALKDSASGINYFSEPVNYDDMNELTNQDIKALITAISSSTNELVIDLSSMCDMRCQTVFEYADVILIIADGGKSASAKLEQFIAQHNLFGKIQSKAILVGNKGYKGNDNRFSKTINLPLVSSSDPNSVYKTLSGIRF